MVQSERVQDARAWRWIVLGGSATTVLFFPSLNDPFNSPKSWILCLAGLWLLGWLIFHYKGLFQNVPLKVLAALSALFFISLSIDLFTTDNFYIGLFGDYGRRTGFLTYLAFLLFLLASVLVFNRENIEDLDSVFIVVGGLIGLYGFLQHFKIDFIQWNNPYNPVISTFGNPDFAAAAMAIFLIVNFGLLITARATWKRFASLANIVVLMSAIVFSQTRQGLLIAGFGCSLIAVIWITQRFRGAMVPFFALGLITAAFAVAGILNKGPARHFLYKNSVALRGDYWRAAWRMFIAHPWIGVGLDRYGANFRSYRDHIQVARYGPGVISNAAHNVLLQILATGGLVLLLPLLALIFFTLWRGVTALKNSSGRSQIVIGTIFAAWLGYQLESLISIDNVAIAVWGYILGGAVISISFSLSTSQSLQRGSLARGKGRVRGIRESSMQPLISGLICLPAVVIFGLMAQNEMHARTLSATGSPTQSSQLPAYRAFAGKIFSTPIQEPTLAISAATKLASVGDFNHAENELEKILHNDPRSYDAADTLAAIYEYQKNYAQATKYRRIILTLDPLNNKNADDLQHDVSLASK